jgi:hypothetical protein
LFVPQDLELSTNVAFEKDLGQRPGLGLLICVGSKLIRERWRSLAESWRKCFKIDWRGVGVNLICVQASCKRTIEDSEEEKNRYETTLERAALDNAGRESYFEACVEFGLELGW